MSNYANLKSAIQYVIKANGNNEITGNRLQTELISMINTLGYGYQFMGIATPTTVPGTPDARVFYIAFTPGTYPNFDGILVTGLCVLKYATSWTKEDIPVSGGGGSYTLPVATAETLGGVKIGSGLQINNEGVLSVPGGGGGSVGFTTEPNDLTLTTIGGNNVLKFADRLRETYLSSGYNYVILRENLSFDSQLIGPKTIYEIRYDFDLNGASVRLPSNTCLKFVGGSVNNGTILLNDNVTLYADVNAVCKNLMLSYDTDLDFVSIKNICFISDQETPYAIGTGNTKILNGCSIIGCRISGYIGGIIACVSNALISDNLIFGCGKTTLVSNMCDIRLEYSVNAGIADNIIISGNRCLSKNVDTHIRVGQLYAETHVVIANNICVAMNDDLSAEASSYMCRHCIQVGYASTSTDRDKSAIIIGNFCKYATYGGIYVRGNSNVDNIGISKFVVIISNNFVMNVNTDGVAHICAAIAAELQAGSVIHGNIVRNCDNGISTGFMYSDMDAIVSSNTIDVSGRGVHADTYCKKLQVQGNQIISSAGTGVDVSLSSSVQTQDEIDGKITVHDNSIVAPTAISIYNFSVACVSVEGNILISKIRGTNGRGVILSPIVTNVIPRISISGNTIRNFDQGIWLPRFTNRNENLTVSHNVIIECNTGIYLNNSAARLFVVVFDNRFSDCTTERTEGVIDGYFGKGGVATLFGIPSGAFLNSASIFKRGDRVYFTGIGWNDTYKGAICVTASTIDGDGNPVANTAKWRIEHLVCPSATRESIQPSLASGQMCLDTTLQRYCFWNGTKWCDEQGFTLAAIKGATADRPTLAIADKGYMYFDTDLGKPIYAQSITSGGVVTWVDAAGQVV